MHLQAGPLRLSRLFPLDAQDVHAKGGGEGGQRRVRAAERRRDDADGKENQDAIAQDARRAEHRQYVVAQRGQRDALPLRQRKQEHAQREEQEVDRREGEAVGVHILLRVAQALAGKVLLHHVLIQARHDDGDENAAEELLREVLRAVPVAELEDTEPRALADGPCHAHEVQPHPVLHLPDNHHQHRHEAYGLQRVGPDNRPHAAPESVEPHEEDAQDSRHDEGDVPGVEHVRLQDEHHEVQPCRRPDNLRQQEERRARLIAPPPDACVQIGVDGGQPQLVVKRQQDVRNEDVADEEAQHRLHIGHIDAPHHAGHGDERHARQRRADHADGDDVPRRLPFAQEERLVAIAAPRDPRDTQQDREVDGDDNQDRVTTHIVMAQCFFSPAKIRFSIEITGIRVDSVVTGSRRARK